jgi:hypothetical protein
MRRRSDPSLGQIGAYTGVRIATFTPGVSTSGWRALRRGTTVQDRHYVYLYRAPSSGTARGKPMYIGYGMSVQRALQHPENSHNSRLKEWLAEGHYTLEVAGPYGDEREGKRVEAALISALDPEFNVARGGPSFRPVGVPSELAERSSLQPLSLEEVGRLAGGALFVYLSDAALTDGRTTYNVAEPDDEAVRSNIEAW